MTTQTHLIHSRRFLPLFATQLLNAFNDNLFKNAMVLYVVYSVYQSEAAEGQFSAIASGLFILPFLLFSATSGQLTDKHNKTSMIRFVKNLEIVIMLIAAYGFLTGTVLFGFLFRRFFFYSHWRWRTEIRTCFCWFCCCGCWLVRGRIAEALQIARRDFVHRAAERFFLYWCSVFTIE